ncbi:hypothetical protein FG379_000022 [Cryptosporidium bovis]|uniref:uncharacterized protein n=1 Tax=Cryptosporidium bovis TaxID=310047 RepID=UPI003519FD26|nr:hypothetical protein FG379_000022 [Cryptosporidium bovis]
MPSSSTSPQELQATASTIPTKHINRLDENQVLSPPSTTLTPSSTPSTTPTYSTSSMNSSNFSQQQQSVISGTVKNTNSAIPSMSPVNSINGVNIPTNNQISTFNNGMLNTAFYSDPNVMQLLLSNLIQSNQSGYMTGMYPINHGYGGSAVHFGSGIGTPYFGNYCIQNGIPIPFGSYVPMNQSAFGLIGGDFSEQLVANKNIQDKVVSASTIIDSKQNQLTPERSTNEYNIFNLYDKKTELPAILEDNTDDVFSKKRRKETSVDSVNSLVETVATETNSTADDTVVKQTKTENDELENSKINLNDENNNSTVVDGLLIQNCSKVKQQECTNNNQVIGESSDSPNTHINNGNGVSSSLLSAIHEEELYMSSDRKTSFDKILRIHASLVGSLSWTPPIDRDDVVLKPALSTSVPVESLNNNSSSASKDNGDNSNTENNNKNIQTGFNEEYNPFKRREYNSANVTCFSPRMLPDWQLNWLRDVTRSLSNVPKSPMTGIHFDRTKPAWAVSYYECETRKYYFFFIPDLSEYTIEITLAAAIGCRQNVVARGAHKRKKPGVLTFNLYSGQFEKSVPESINANLSSGVTSILKANNGSINNSNIFESDFVSFKKDIQEHNIDNNGGRNKGKHGILESSNTFSGNYNLGGLNNLASLAALGTATAALAGSSSGQTPISIPVPNSTSVISESVLGSSNSPGTNAQTTIGVNTFGNNIFDQNIGNIATSGGKLIGLGCNFPFQFNGMPPLQQNNMASQMLFQHLQPSLLYPNTIQAQLTLSGNAHPVTTSAATLNTHHFHIPQYRYLNNNPFVMDTVNEGPGVNIENGLCQQSTVNSSFTCDKPSSNSLSSPLSSSVQVSTASTPSTSTSASTPVSMLSSKISPTSLSSSHVNSDGIDENISK